MNFHSYHSVYPVLHRGNGLSAQQATTTNINGSEAITKINLGLILRDLKSDYSARRKRNTSPPPQLSPSQQPSQSLNINPNNDLDQNRGTNKSGEVCAAIGKHLKGTRIEINVENTVIIDANGLSETIRVIAIYRPAGQIMKLEELEPYISENTIITGDFNASIKECGSESSDKRDTGKTILTKENEISDELYRYCSEQFKAQNADMSDSHEVQIETENGLRLIHRCPFARATDLLQITNEEPLEEYMKSYITKRLKRIEKSDLGLSPFYNDVFYWGTFRKNKNDHMGHFSNETI
ncbi:unnamed protein product [Rotaria magnacalcarata]|uniref:Endonuclease/exonuclease/phosphatase domain-containing protein n=1 Tax=Rotaria magnacalcarata TaxID=392030 RepID=A0A8S2J4K2_9BILA|nr:unnamed protein product [Rotaria magnacalcarata]